MDQATYAGSSARTGGVVAGTASSLLYNKAQRQAANMAAAIAAFIVQEGYDALDNADVTALKNNFISALGVLIASGATPFATLAEVTAGTITGKAVDPAKLAAAVQAGTWRSAIAGGTANALTLTLAPAPTAYTSGMIIPVIIGTTNTGAATINVNGLGAKSIVKPSGIALTAGDLTAGAPALLIYNGTSFSLAGLTNRSPGGSLFTATPGSGSFTVPAGVYKIFVRVWGAGGGGGGAFATSPTNMGACGGSGGGYSEGWLSTTPGASISYTVGAAGAAGSYNGSTGLPGGNGGTSSFGTISATGGQGGLGASNNFPTPTASPGVGSGGDLNLTGVGGWTGFNCGTGNVGGAGGPAAGGGGGITLGTIGTAGYPGQAPGGGGSGAAASGNIGGAGTAGQIIVSW
ncbi:hypothetical protein OSH11_11610 [Kaistia dalseonensis]|uniref:Glycine-rich domain-containing protein n=2 Tax=Kaistia dalseonensis TaxID=410840 RepID=A0ABU0H6L1_9HYPH|nr:hypothetical protein [Kaistia dalseonensis]MDQ0437942.1 hypothetical protein [Kaistia dalseonensis]